MAQALLNDMMTRGPVGFDFSNCTRNLALDSLGVKPPKLHSTGTTIVAVIYQVGNSWVIKYGIEKLKYELYYYLLCMVLSKRPLSDV